MYNFTMTYSSTVTVYQSGNSKVLTIPAKLPVKVGDTFQMTFSDEKIVLEPIQTETIAEQIERMKAMAGQAPGTLGNMTVEEIDKMLEGIYD